MSGPLSILLLADDQRGAPNTIHDHIQAFARYSRHTIETFNPRNLGRSRFLDLDEFDVVVVHYSLAVIWDDYFSPWFRDRVARYSGLKVQFLQDEYRWVDEITAATRSMGIDVLYSVVPPEMVLAVYGDRLPDTEILFTLTGYVPEGVFRKTVPPLDRRAIDVGYRGRSSAYWLGRLGQEKVEVGRGFLARAESLGLRCDIAWSENARIYGDRWYQWMASCRTMLASESGSSIIDYDRSAENGVREYLASRPTASYEEVEDAVLLSFAGGPFINTISPRVFETAAMRTGLVMFPGEYSGIVRPWEHYIPLEKDFSNIDEVAERIRDLDFLEELTSRTYDDLIGSGRYSYRRFVEGFDEEIAERAGGQRRRGRFPTLRLRAEQMSTGRSYHVSSIYGLVRTTLLWYVGLKHSLKRPPLRRLAFLAGRHRAGAPGQTSLWDDLFRIAMLTSIQSGELVPTGSPFRLHASLEDGRLTFTSTLANESADDAEAVRAAAAIRGGWLREIVWNHAAIGQYVTLPLPLTEKRISFDVGRYDAYGVYRFDRLLEVSREDPALALAALQPLLMYSDSEAQ